MAGRNRSKSLAQSARALLADAHSLMRDPRRLTRALVLLAVAVWVLAGGVGGMQRRDEARERFERMSETVAALKVERHRLRAEVRSLEEDPAALELLAKSAHDLAAPDEIVVLLPDDPPIH